MSVKMKISAAIGAFVLALLLPLGGCALLLLGSVGVSTAQAQACTPSSSVGTAPVNSTLFQAIKLDTAGNPRLALGIFMASYIESKWGQDNFGVGSYGVLQIQGPGVVHPGITIPQALNPAFSVNFMMPAFRASLAKVERNEPGLWASDPERAGERVAFHAERPGGWPDRDYYVTRSPADVRVAYVYSLSAMQSVGISTDFASGLVAVSAPQPSNTSTSSPAADTGCATPLNPSGNTSDPGNGPPNPSGQGIFFNLRPRAVNLVKYVQANWDCSKKADPCVYGYEGWRAGDPVAADHPGGYAVDFNVEATLGVMPSPPQISFGWGMACFFQAHATDLGIQYVIWQNKIWNVSRGSEGGPGGCGGTTTGWRDYNCGPYGPGCPLTQQHADHVHVTLRTD